MSGSRSALPASLRDAVAADLRPVRPLRPVWQRSLVVAVWFVGVIIAVSMLTPAAARAQGASASTLALIWGPPLLQLLVGLAMVHGALREAVPGLGLPRRVVFGVSAGAIVLQLAVAVFTFQLMPGPLYEGSRHLWAGAMCARFELLLGAPALAATLWLALRAYPVRPLRAGLLGGLGVGLFADGLAHIKCPMTDLRHVLVWHLGGMLALALVGALVGHLAGLMHARRGRG